jgi:hypothetical protein
MKGPQILHIAQDEKFINAAHYLFELAFPGQNKFVIVKPAADPPIKFIDENWDFQYEVMSADTDKRLAAMSNKHQITVFHGLNKFKGSVFLRSENQSRFMTIIYGAEIYNSEIIGGEFIGPATQKLRDTLERKTTIVDAVKDVYRKIAYKDIRKYEEVDLAEVLYKMPVFGSLPGFSYNHFIANGIYNPAVAKISFTYYPIEFIINNADLRVRGENILLGNSASATNNHLEAFEQLKEINLNQRKIIAPLSYGKKKYARAIKAYGERMFPDNFTALTTFLPLEEYNKIISQCGFVIMNHSRPQAVGNIIAALYMGSKVFLNNTAAYQYFKQLGCHVFLIERDLRGEDSFQLLSEEQISHNRKVLQAELSIPILVDKMRTAFSQVFNFEPAIKRVQKV